MTTQQVFRNTLVVILTIAAAYALFLSIRILIVLLVAIIQNGLNLLGVSPYAFKMVVGAIILLAISTSNIDLARLVTPRKEGRE